VRARERGGHEVGSVLWAEHAHPVFALPTRPCAQASHARHVSSRAMWAPSRLEGWPSAWLSPHPSETLARGPIAHRQTRCVCRVARRHDMRTIGPRPC
jgi:hypothetical protein